MEDTRSTIVNTVIVISILARGHTVLVYVSTTHLRTYSEGVSLESPLDMESVSTSGRTTADGAAVWWRPPAAVELLVFERPLTAVSE